MKTRRFAVALCLALSVSCGKARHIGVQADFAYSTILFAIDDAQIHACNPAPAPGLSEALCSRLNAAIKHGLDDGKALTQALQASPRDGVVPQNLADVLADLNNFSQILNEAKASPSFGGIAEKVAEANAKLIALLKQLAGG